MTGEQVIVYKDKASREIHTFVHLAGHGARVELSQFISLLAEAYGSPTLTMTRKGLLEGLQEACEAVVLDMKRKTVGVAAVNLEPEVKSP